MTLSEKNNTFIKKALVFTLIEVVVAIAILGIGLSTIFYTFSSSTQNINQAQKIWANQHLMNNLCEWYLLMGEDEHPPRALLPDGFRGDCKVELYENIPDEKTPAYIYDGDGEIKGWYLGKYTITLISPRGEVIQSHEIEKIMRDPNE